MKKLAAKYASSLLAVIASVFVVTASGIVWHMPETPKELLKK